MRKLYFIFMIFSCFLVMVSCKKERLPHDDIRIHISLNNHIAETGEHLYYLSFQTNKIYPCLGYGLDISTTFENGRLEVEIRDVIEPQGACLTALGPAGAAVELLLPDNGQYPLHIRAFGRSNTGTISAEEDAYSLHLGNARNVVVVRDKLFKIPEHTIWGIVGYASTLLEPAVANFIHDLETLGATHQGLAAGHYGPFDVESDGNKVLPEFHGYHHAATVLYRYDGDEETLLEKVKQYGSRYEGLSINIYGANGARYHSWIH